MKGFPKPEDCARPACDTIKSMFAKSMKSSKRTISSQEETSDLLGCPVDREELGRGTWDLLHTMAAWFPDKPSSSEKDAARSLVSSLALLYPCTHCAADFQESIRDSPPQVESRTIFAVWLCRQHNLVNVKLNKPTFDCSMENLDLRWRNGAPHCFEERERLGVETSRESLGRD